MRLNDFPEQMWDWLRLHFDTPLKTTQLLRAEVQGHIDRTEREFEKNPFVDRETGNAIGASCLKLLRLCEGASDDVKRAIQVACDYYVESEDDDSDFASVVGFDDDAQVLNIVCEWLGRADLKIEVP